MGIITDLTHRNKEKIADSRNVSLYLLNPDVGGGEVSQRCLQPPQLRKTWKAEGHRDPWCCRIKKELLSPFIGIAKGLIDTKRRILSPIVDLKTGLVKKKLGLVSGLVKTKAGLVKRVLRPVFGIKRSKLQAVRD